MFDPLLQHIDYTVETLFTPIDALSTKMEFYHYYSTKSIKAKFLHLIAKRKIARQSLDSLKAIKEHIEIEQTADSLP